ncbi:hypothetical protein SAMN05216436_10484 [bacterium A37T11]|nr:hypothetical protein SAMN05216436_10484 [bacterium A37T11]
MVGWNLHEHFLVRNKVRAGYIDLRLFVYRQNEPFTSLSLTGKTAHLNN